MSEMKKWLEKHAPLGIDVSTHVGLYLFCMFIATLHSMLFLLAYGNAVNALYDYHVGKKVLREGAMIVGFDVLTEGIFTTGIAMCIVTLLVVIYYYLYHYQGSKMMYLMRRLPDKTEVIRRCWTLPITGSVLMAAWMFVLRMIYYAIYILCTPSQCLPL